MNNIGRVDHVMGKSFSLVPEMRLNYIYSFSYVENQDESYFTYSLHNPEIILTFVMNISGQIKQLSWLKHPNNGIYFGYNQ